MKKFFLNLISVLLTTTCFAQNTVINFQNFNSGTVITDQYENEGGNNRGVVFGIGVNEVPSSYNYGDLNVGFNPGVSSNNLNKWLETKRCQKEVCVSPYVWGKFLFTKKLLKLQLTTSSQNKIQLIAYDINGMELGIIEKNVAGYALVEFKIERASADIVFFKIIGKEQWSNIIIDDLTFDNPAIPPAPNFGITTPSLNLSVKEGSAITAPIYINRVNGAQGEIQLSFDGVFSFFPVTRNFLPTSKTAENSLLLYLEVPKIENLLFNTQPFTVIGKPAPGVTTAGTGERKLQFNLGVYSMFDTRITGIEVTQGIQSEVQPCTDMTGCLTNQSLPMRNEADPTAEVPYAGVLLVQGKKTLARVFANIRVPVSPAGRGAIVELYGYAENGSLLPESPLESAHKQLQNGMSYVSFKERTADNNPDFQFILPDSWTRQKFLKLKARLVPDAVFINNDECTDQECFANDQFILKNIEFVNTGYITVATARLHFDGEDVFSPDPNSIFSESKLWLPLAEGALRYDPTGYFATMNITPLRTLYPMFSDSQTDDFYDFRSAARSYLVDYADEHPGCEWADFCSDMIVGVYPGGGQSNETLPDDQPVSVGANGVTIAHELSHGLGRLHADQNCGGNSNGQVGEPWLPDNNGLMRGVGIDLRSYPYRIIAPASLGASSESDTYVDYMSYCKFGIWTSVRGQLTNLLLLKNIREDLGRASVLDTKESIRYRDVASRNETAPFHAFGQRNSNLDFTQAMNNQIRVIAYQNAAGGVEITHIKPSAGRLIADDTSAYRLILKDGNNNIIKEVGMRSGHESEGKNISLTAEVIAANIRSMEISRAGKILARREATANPPKVQITIPSSQLFIKEKGIILRYTATDSDNDRLAIKVDFSPNAGALWLPVFAGPNTGSATIPVSQVVSTHNAMVRVRANDGFHETVAVSKEFVVVGAGPKVQIIDPIAAKERIVNVKGINNRSLNLRIPQTTVKLFNGETHQFRGLAYNEHRQPMSNEQLQWYIGRTKIGSGENITVKTLPVGNHVVRLVASDKNGRTAEDSVAIEVKQSIPRFLTLTAPTIVSTNLREVTIQASTSVPCVLKAAGKTYNLNRSVQNIKLPITARTNQLELLLKAGDELSLKILKFRRID